MSVVWLPCELLSVPNPPLCACLSSGKPAARPDTTISAWSARLRRSTRAISGWWAGPGIGLDICKDSFLYSTGILTIQETEMDAQELRPIVSGLFAGAPTRTTRVGIEQELLVADAAGRTVPVPRLRALLAGCPLAAYVAYEPGGQLELNLPPSDSPASAEVQLRVSLRDVRDHLERAGIR